MTDKELELQSIEAYKAWLDDKSVQVEFVNKEKDIGQSNWLLCSIPEWSIKLNYYRIRKKKKIISQFRCYDKSVGHFGVVLYYENRDGVAYNNFGNHVSTCSKCILIPGTDMEIDE